MKKILQYNNLKGVSHSLAHHVNNAQHFIETKLFFSFIELYFQMKAVQQLHVEKFGRPQSIICANWKSRMKKEKTMKGKFITTSIKQ